MVSDLRSEVSHSAFSSRNKGYSSKNKKLWLLSDYDMLEFDLASCSHQNARPFDHVS
jgi:hypothetical protein